MESLWPALILLSIALEWSNTDPNVQQFHGSTKQTAVDLKRKVTCENEVFHPACEVGSRLLMTSAAYGRMSLSRCVQWDYGHLGCSADVLAMADRKCSGLRTCAIRVPDADFATLNQCPHDLKPHFTANYTCVEVLQRSQPCGDGVAETIRQSKGYISGGTLAPSDQAIQAAAAAAAADNASITSSSSSKQPASCRWSIEARPGQRIQIALYDFALVAGRPTGDPRASCRRRYAQITERADDHMPMTVCGGQVRHHIVHTSTSLEVQLDVRHDVTEAARDDDAVGDANAVRFLFYFRVLGCPDLAVDSSMWVIRNGDVTEVGCRTSDDKWTMKCDVMKWVGSIGNCTAGLLLEQNVTEESKFKASLTISVLVLVGTSVLIGFIILLLGFLFVSLLKESGMVRTRRRVKEAELRASSAHSLPVDQCIDRDDDDDGAHAYTSVGLASFPLVEGEEYVVSAYDELHVAESENGDIDETSEDYRKLIELVETSEDILVLVVDQ